MQPRRADEKWHDGEARCRRSGQRRRRRWPRLLLRLCAGADVAQSMASGIVSNTTARELGDLFEYRINTPVTVRKSESAMLPFLQQKIDARKLLIYSDQSSVHPMNAAEVTNSTGKTLDGGPITVYDAGAYAGEALVETVKQGDKRLISYAVDLGTRITTAFDSKGEVVREIHLRRGVLTTRVAAQETRTYTIKNVDAESQDADHRASGAPADIRCSIGSPRKRRRARIASR